MNQRNVLLGFLVLVLVAFGGMVFYDIKHGHKFEKLFKKQDQANNWQWNDDWNGKPPTGPTTPDRPVTPDTPTPPSNPTGPQLVAGTYAEALQKAGAEGKPVMAFFTADWCTWCKKMKSETMADPSVQAVLKNYVLVYVDTDKDRAPARKFGVESLPSYVITNAKEEKLKFDSGFKNADTFASWLNNPSLFNQPKNEVRPTPPPSNPEKKDDRKDNQRRRRPGDRTQPPQHRPDMQPGNPNCPPGG